MKKLMSLLLVVLAVSAVSSLACTGAGSNDNGNTTIGTRVSVDGGFYTNVNSSELNQMLKNKDFILVNTDLIVTKAIPDTDLYIPMNEVLADLSLVSQNKEEKIVIYCMVGANSSVVAAEFVRMGYTNIYNLSGGITEWEQQGYPVVTP